MLNRINAAERSVARDDHSSNAVGKQKIRSILSHSLLSLTRGIWLGRLTACYFFGLPWWQRLYNNSTFMNNGAPCTSRYKS